MTIITFKMRVVLPSNSSMKHFPENTLTTYTVKLSNPVDLSVGQWECALTEIQFVKSWTNVKNASLSLSEGGKHVTINIPDDYYSSPEELINTINENIQTQKPDSFNDYGLTFKYDKRTKKVEITMLPITEDGLQMDGSKSFNEIMGINSLKVTSMTDEFWKMKTEDPIRLIYIQDIMVYTDIVQGSIVGDAEAPLLRVVSVEKDHWINQCTIYQSPQYLPISKTKLQSISILLRTDSGELVPFTNGRTLVTLDFRRVKPVYTY